MSGDEDKKSDSEQGQEKYRCDEEQYKLLKECLYKKDMTGWNNWRKENPSKEILLQGADLNGSNLQGLDFEKANLQGALLRYVNLQNACLNRVNLQNADLRGAALQHTSLSMANLRDAILEEVDLKGAYLMGTNLQNTNFSRANLRFADFRGTNLQGVCFIGANLQRAFLAKVNLQGAKLEEANLQGAQLEEANLKASNISYGDIRGANFAGALVDGETIIWECKVNKYLGSKSWGTNFNGVGLDSIRIDAATKQLLKYNIRRMNWEKWYKGKSENKLIVALCKVVTSPVRLFWSMSDYGLSTMRIIGTFFFLAILFAAIYANCAHFCPPGIVDSLTVEPHFPLWHYRLLLILRPVYFSVVTMTTLGFGDMYAQKQSIAGHLLLTFQVILGYVLLGALVTRFAVLFTAGGPAGKFSK